MTTDRMQLRVAAVALAAQLDANELGPRHVGIEQRIREALKGADQIYAWYIAAQSLTLTFGPVTDQATGQVVTPAPEGAPPMANLELGDTDQVTATAVPLDADKQPTTDTLTWTASVPAALTLTPSADTLSCLILGAVPTESVVVTATDSAGNETTGEIDVVAGPATSLSLSFGPVTPQTPAVPAPAPTA
jgi:hypothetical protein